MLTIDIHTHILPEHIPNFREKFGYGGFVRLDHHKPCCARMIIDDKFFREVQDNSWSPETRMKECDAHHVHVQVLSTVPVMFSYWANPYDALEVSKFLNDHLADIVEKYPTRFVGLGTVPLQAPDLAIKELERCMKMGLKGVEIGSHVNEWNLSEPVLLEFFKAAEEMGAAIFVHPWDMMGQDRMQKYWLPWLVGMPAETSLAICSMIFGGVFEKCPNLRVAFAHGGGSFPSTIGRIEHGFDCRPDLVAIDNPKSPREYMGKFWLDSLVHSPDMLDMIVKLVGPNRVALGTDYPFPLGETTPAKLINSMGYDDKKRAQLLHGAALEWLDMKKEQFTL